jgi:hypothetical protein
VRHGETRLLMRRRCSPRNDDGWPDELAARLLLRQGRAKTEPRMRRPRRGHSCGPRRTRARGRAGARPGRVMAGLTTPAVGNGSRDAREGRARRAARRRKRERLGRPAQGLRELATADRAEGPAGRMPSAGRAGRPR